MEKKYPTEKIKQTIRENGTVKVQTLNTKPTRTKQSYRDMVNANNIIKKYKTTGMINHITSKDGTYGDFTEIKDYSESLNTIIKAKKQFEQIPSEIRTRFANNPQKLIEFLADPKNQEESIKLGLRVKRDDPNDAKKPEVKT